MNKNKILKDYPLHVELQTRWRDLDAFGHVNNAVFATYIENARGMLFKKWNLPFDGTGQSLIVASITINYYQQLKHPTDIVIGQKISRIGNSSFDVESALFNKNDQTRPIATSKVIVVCFDFEQQKSVPVFEQIIEDSKL